MNSVGRTGRRHRLERRPNTGAFAHRDTRTAARTEGPRADPYARVRAISGSVET
ncbi:hypothetical protein ABK046_08510 [Streptomyces caeruleatus]